MHGANRLGGNGVANSTVFGGIAGDAMAKLGARSGAWREPDDDALAGKRHRAPWRRSRRRLLRCCAGWLEAIRERLFATMWDDAGIVRDAAGLDTRCRHVEAARRSARSLSASRRGPRSALQHDLARLAQPVEPGRRSQVIVRAAQARENSRGAHFRSDFPDAGDLATSTYTRLRGAETGVLSAEGVPVEFTRVRPGQSLI